MHSHIKTLTLISGALLCGCIIYSLHGCDKDPLGKKKAWVAEQNSNRSQQQAAQPMATPTQTGEVTVASSPAAPKEKTAQAAKQGRQVYAITLADVERDKVEVIKGAKAKRVDFVREEVARVADKPGGPPTPMPLSDAVPPLSSEPSVLIAEASALLQQERASLIGLRIAFGQLLGATLGGSVNGEGTKPRNYIQLALERAQRAVDLIKQQPEPADAELKAQYLATKRAALAVQAETLGLLASSIDRTQVSTAEAAYREYLATETDPVKLSRGENDLATLLYRSAQWEKAKTAYQYVLIHDPENTQALGRLAAIMRRLAKQQEAVGDLAEAKKSSQAAVAYSERLQEVEDANRRATKYADKAAPIKSTEAKRGEAKRIP